RAAADPRPSGRGLSPGTRLTGALGLRLPQEAGSAGICAGAIGAGAGWRVGGAKTSAGGRRASLVSHRDRRAGRDRGTGHGDYGGRLGGVPAVRVAALIGLGSDGERGAALGGAGEHWAG